MAETARALGFDLLEWQRHVADVGLEFDPGSGRPIHRDVLVSSPRQQGKSILVLALLVWRMLSAPGQRVGYAAQSRLAARAKLFDDLYPRLAGSPLGPLFKLQRATGAEGLRASNGSILRLASTDQTAMHGESLDFFVADEAWSLSPDVEAAVKPAMLARPSAQFFMVSTAGNERSAWFRSKIEAGRLAVKTGLSDGPAFMEWSADPEDDPGDPETWRRCMPALGHTISEDTIRQDMAVMPISEFRRGMLNQWPEDTSTGWAVFDPDIWQSMQIR